MKRTQGVELDEKVGTGRWNMITVFKGLRNSPGDKRTHKGTTKPTRGSTLSFLASHAPFTLLWPRIPQA